MNERYALAPVLLVDDGAAAHTRLAGLLDHWGWPADALIGATAAFQRLRSRNYGCVICGHHMVGGNGLALAQRWPQIQDPTTPLLVSAAGIDAATLEQYTALGVWVLAQDGASCAELRLWIAQVLALRAWGEEASSGATGALTWERLPRGADTPGIGSPRVPSWVASCAVGLGLAIARLERLAGATRSSPGRCRGR